MKLNLVVIIPVLVPSNFFEDLKYRLCNYNMDVIVNFINDFSNTIDNLPKNRIESYSENVRGVNGIFGSPGAARNEGLKVSESEYLCFWDVDDEPNLDEVVHLVEQMKLHEADVGIGNWSFFERQDDPKGINVVAVGSSPGIWRFVFRREFITGLIFSDLKWGEDQLFLAQVLARKPKVITSNKIIYSYRKDSPGSLTADKSLAVSLLSSLAETIPLANNLRGKLGLCLEIMIFRQVFTLFRYGGLRLGVKAILKVFKSHKKVALVKNITHIFFKNSRSWN